MKKVIVIVLSCLLVVALILLGVFGFFYKKSSDEINEITSKIEESFQEIDVEFSQGDEITCEDFQLQLIDNDLIPEGSIVSIEINGKKLSDGENFVFDKIGKYTVKVEILNNYSYPVISNTKAIHSEKTIEINVVK